MNDFINNLRTEILDSQKRRADLVKQKFTFVIGAFGLASLSLGGAAPSIGLLFLAPLIAFAFDLYIVGEDFGIKRAGAFRAGRKSGASAEERDWEEFCRKHRDHFSMLAGPFVSIITLVASGFALKRSEAQPTSAHFVVGLDCVDSCEHLIDRWRSGDHPLPEGEG